MESKERISRLTNNLRNVHETSDPFRIAADLGVLVQIGDLGSRYGYYMYLKRHKCIFLNEKLDEHTMKFVMAHELGHALLHPHENCNFIRNHTLLNTSKIEKEANLFAVLLLFGSEDLTKYAGCSFDELKHIFGYNDKITNIRYEIFDV